MTFVTAGEIVTLVPRDSPPTLQHMIDKAHAGPTVRPIAAWPPP